MGPSLHTPLHPLFKHSPRNDTRYRYSINFGCDTEQEISRAYMPFYSRKLFFIHLFISSGASRTSSHVHYAAYLCVFILLPIMISTISIILISPTNLHKSMPPVMMPQGLSQLKCWLAAHGTMFLSRIDSTYHGVKKTVIRAREGRVIFSIQRSLQINPEYRLLSPFLFLPFS